MLSADKWPWLVVRDAGVDEYHARDAAVSDAAGGVVVSRAQVRALPAVLALAREVAKPGPGVMPTRSQVRRWVTMARAAIARAEGR